MCPLTPPCLPDAPRSNTVTVKDVLMSLKFRGHTLYGFGSIGLVPLELWQRRIKRLREPLVVETRSAVVPAVCVTTPLRQVRFSILSHSRRDFDRT